MQQNKPSGSSNVINKSICFQLNRIQQVDNLAQLHKIVKRLIQQYNQINITFYRLSHLIPYLIPLRCQYSSKNCHSSSCMAPLSHRLDGFQWL